ncbi:hypothetical protein ACMFMF_005207 [Clarireedia jacksonii]
MTGRGEGRKKREKCDVSFWARAERTSNFVDQGGRGLLAGGWAGLDWLHRRGVIWYDMIWYDALRVIGRKNREEVSWCWKNGEERGYICSLSIPLFFYTIQQQHHQFNQLPLNRPFE